MPLLPTATFKYNGAVGLTNDIGDYEAHLARALQMADVAGYPARKAESEAKGKKRGRARNAPKFDLRANASAFRSRVKTVPGPDNRLDQQPPATILGEPPTTPTSRSPARRSPPAVPLKRSSRQPSPRAPPPP